MKPLTLTPVDRNAQLTSSALAHHLRSDALRTAAAARWARALEVSVTIRDAGIARPNALAPSIASAGLLLADGRRACLTVSTQVLTGLMGALAGAVPRSVGPMPLSPAEEGLFAFLVLQWTGLWVAPPALDWVDGGTGLIPHPDFDSESGATSAVSWHITVADQTGIARWHLPANLSPPSVCLSDRPHLPIHGTLSAGRARWGGVLSPGDLVVLRTPAALQFGNRFIPVRWHAGRWSAVEMKEVRMPDSIEELPVGDLPLTLDAIVGRITLTVADVAALAPGVVLPLAADTTPIVTLMAGGTPIARGILVDDDGHTAVQVTQLIAAPT